MILHDVDQRSPEWYRLRAGIPTASEFDKIITRTGKHSTQADAYSNRLGGEWLMGGSDNTFESQAMFRGKHLEDEACAYYEMQRDMTTDPGGFVTTDDGKVGCSPDRLVYAVGDNSAPIGGLEIKCAMIDQHMQYVFDGSCPDKYRHQVQGCLWVTGLAWWDVLAYHPELPPALHRVEPDQKWLDAFVPMMKEFLADLENKKSWLLRQGYTPAGGAE